MQLSKFFRAKYISVLVIILSLLAALIYQSRAFMMGEVAGLLFLIFFYKKIRPDLRNLVLITVILSVCFASLITFYKHDSYLGRVFIYKISFQLFKDNYVKGIGPGNYPVKYNLYQAHYFEKKSYTEKEFLLADNVSFAFNDYWQFIVETGFAGFFILVLLFAVLLSLISRAIHYQPQNPILVICISQLIAILTAALFTHIFEILLFQLIIFLSLVYIYSCSKRKFNRSACLFLCFVTIASLLSFKYINSIRNYEHYSRFKEAKDLLEAGYINSSLQTCAEIYPYLKDDISFLSFYSTNLIYSKKDKESLALLKHLAELKTTNELYQKMGDVYFAMGDHKQAEKYYILSVNMVPNRFGTRLSLFNYYLSIKNRLKACQTGNTILNMPVKIMSAEVNQIKTAVNKNYLNNFYLQLN